jgi:hypothetical protein
LVGAAAAAVILGAVAFLVQVVLGPQLDVSRFGYVALLIAGAAFLALGVKKRNGPYAFLILIGIVYFLIFGLAPLFQNLGLVPRPAVTQHVEDVAQRASLLGLLMIVVGFLAGSRATAAAFGRGLFQAEWPAGRGLIVGVLFWAVGIVCYVIAFMLSDPGHHRVITVFGLPQNVLTNLVLLYPVGAIIVTYAALQRRTRLALGLLILMGIVNFLVGYWGNTKEMCLLVPVLVVLILYFTTGRTPAKLIVLLVVGMVPFYWIFDSRRALAEYQSPAQLLQDVGKSVDRIAKNVAAYKNPVSDNSKTLLARVDGYQYLLVIVDGIENHGQKLQDGFTLMILPYSFVPRFWWPEKPDLSTGQLFNRTFHLSLSELTYIPSTQLGEFYWNFMLPGVILGMLIHGFVIGAVNRSLDLSVSTTAPRLVAFLGSVYYLVLLMGGSVALPYAGWVRSMVMLGVFHACISRRTMREPPRLPTPIPNILR